MWIETWHGYDMEGLNERYEYAYHTPLAFSPVGPLRERPGIEYRYFMLEISNTSDWEEDSLPDYLYQALIYRLSLDRVSPETIESVMEYEDFLALSPKGRWKVFMEGVAWEEAIVEIVWRGQGNSIRALLEDATLFMQTGDRSGGVRFGGRRIR